MKPLDYFVQALALAVCTVVLLATCAPRVFAADADPNGFQFRERQVPHPCYQSTVLDCVELMQQQGTPAYCEWAAAVVAYAVWQRENGVKERDVKLATPRELTSYERRHVRAWIHEGYLSSKAPYFAMVDARDLCMAVLKPKEK